MSTDSSEPQLDRRFIDAPHRRIVYIERGGGPTALFLHSLPLSSTQWLDMIASDPPGLALGLTEIDEDVDPPFSAQAQTIADFGVRRPAPTRDIRGVKARIGRVTRINGPDRLYPSTLDIHPHPHRPEKEMLELRPGCERCDLDLPPDSTEARICSFECTFCVDCAGKFPDDRCPNCGGELVVGPRRPAELLGQHPASGARVYRPDRTPAA